MMSRNIFESPADMPHDRTTDDAMTMKMSRQHFPKDTSIAVTMTPEQDRLFRATSWPCSDAMSVDNLERPRVGHKV